MGLFGKKSYELPANEEAGAQEASRGHAAPQRAPELRPSEGDRYGIEKAIMLMRALPVKEANLELTVQVVKRTLESTNVKISAIIEDAGHRQSQIQSRIESLRSEVSNLETEILKRNTEIEMLESDYAETTQVKERLTLAENLDRQPGSAPKKEIKPREGAHQGGEVRVQHGLSCPQETAEKSRGKLEERSLKPDKV